MWLFTFLSKKYQQPLQWEFPPDPKVGEDADGGGVAKGENDHLHDEKQII